MSQRGLRLKTGVGHQDVTDIERFESTQVGEVPKRAIGNLCALDIQPLQVLPGLQR
jgi:hypothetical protein